MFALLYLFVEHKMVKADVSIVVKGFIAGQNSWVLLPDDNRLCWGQIFPIKVQAGLIFELRGFILNEHRPGTTHVSCAGSLLSKGQEEALIFIGTGGVDGYSAS